MLRDIETFEPTAGNWLVLEDLLAALWASGVTPEHLPSLFGVFERFPDDDGEGVLWSIVHGIESLPFDYEDRLRESSSRKPSMMADIMIARLEKSKKPPLQ